ncbi:division/cell wall cluster transcriptional repressor MraZ [Lewinella sp. W8]|uniref:division/cell wall cluster transcriptional repressor MraZ n=1 Tax=Lewinella sp. W8 TaxID=2528208 RepID=UPI001067B8F7|nr:division/cell wall cluster transcriptional repressor MraZ [Lewinella sp. W8]MTB51297.1 division/cell wall cluster transcriptional repressor MraZ [Lewinella sp. W8]
MAPQYDLLGEYEVTLDAKGRFRIPSGLLKNLGDRDTLKFVVNRGLGNCLALYPKPVWDEIKQEVDALNKNNQQNLRYVRAFYRGATEVVPDSADRLLLPKRLVSWAKMEKNLVMTAMNDRIEIWAEAEYDLYLEQEPDDLAALAEEVLGDSPRENDL